LGILNRILLILTFLTFGSIYALAQEKNGSKGGFLDFNFYPYTEVKGDNSFTLNIFSHLPNRFQYFSLNNFSNQNDRSELSETTGFYSEQNLRWAITDELPIDLTAQWNLLNGNNNDRFRLGVRWRLNQTSGLKKFFDNIKTSYSINVHAIQFDHDVGSNWQIEHVYRAQLLERLYLSGFGDHNLGGPNGPKWVTEHQLGYRVFDAWYAICEFRRNEARVGKENSLGLGIEYIISH
jgi:hypothetical protein